MFNKSAIKERKQIVHLLHKHVKGELNSKERNKLDEWAAKSEKNRQLLQDVTNQQILTSDIVSFSSFNWDDAARKLAENGVPVVQGSIIHRTFNISRLMAAASIFLALSISAYWWFYHSRSKPVPQAQLPEKAKPVEVVPGSFKARLTLADGSVVILDSAALGRLTTQGQTSIENKKGQLVYDGKAAISEEKVLYNTLTTGKGESYSVVLADGTKVWLNAASSVHYPLTFPGSNRIVEVSGEAYFEVAKDLHQPFIVRANGMEIKVTGTVFNVNAYGDEDKITTTLLEGKVQVTKEKRTQVLLPGQQAELLSSGTIQLKKDADIDKAVGWKKGLFVFKEDDVQSLMNQLSRWYDVNVVYRGTIKDKFTGIIDRNLPVTVVLEMLEKSTVHFQIEGRTITVTP
jgi:transmembrane sensor